MMKLPQWLAPRKRARSCPYCGAPLAGAKQYMISWIEDKREFQVSLGFWCSCAHNDSEVVKHIPLIIAERSRCSCGAALMLKSYSFRRTYGELTFEGVYACKECAREELSTVGKLISGLSDLWKSTKRIEVGLSGVKYERK